MVMIPSQAGAQVFLSASHKDQADGSMSHKIQVRAEVDGADANTMMIVKKGSEYIAIDQQFADKDGKVEFSFDCNTPGSYEGYINTEKTGQKELFSYEILDTAGYDQVELEFNSATDANILQVIEDNKNKLLLDTKFYSDEKKAEVSTKLLAECGALEGSQISKMFDKSIITAYLYGEGDNDTKLEVIEYYNSSYFGLTNQTSPKNIYNDFLGFSDADKNTVFALVEAKNPELDQFRVAVNESIALTAIGNFAVEELDQFILSNNDYLGLSGYSGYTPTKRKNIILALKESPIGSTADYRTAYDKYIEEMNTPAQGGGSSSGGGGGGGGGGSSAKPNKNVIEIPKVPPEKAPDEQENEKPEANQTVAASFNDLESVAWAKDAILSLASKGIVSGREGGAFVPNDSITRAELTAMVVNAFFKVDPDATCDFADIPQDDWSYGYVSTALSKGVIFGLGDGSFGKNTKITRQDISAILYRVLSYTKAMPKVETVSNQIKDFDEISDYAKNAVLMLSQVGIVNGFEDGSFLPAKSATRAEAAVMINRAMGVVNK